MLYLSISARDLFAKIRMSSDLPLPINRANSSAVITHSVKIASRMALVEPCAGSSVRDQRAAAKRPFQEGG
jgi:hypothetical protein